MLAGQAQAMETVVYKSTTVSDLWGDQPVVFRLFMLPAILYAVFSHRKSKQELVFLNLGKAGEELDLLNEDCVSSPDDPVGMKTVAYVADGVFEMGASKPGLRHAVITGLVLLQTAVWCVKGDNIVLLVMGDHGGQLPDWSWEYVQQGPQITNVRLKAFDDPSDGSEGSEPSQGSP